MNSDSVLELLDIPLEAPEWVQFLREYEHELEVISPTVNRYVFAKFGMELYDKDVSNNNALQSSDIQ